MKPGQDKNAVLYMLTDQAMQKKLDELREIILRKQDIEIDSYIINSPQIIDSSPQTSQVIQNNLPTYQSDDSLGPHQEQLGSKTRIPNVFKQIIKLSLTRKGNLRSKNDLNQNTYQCKQCPNNQCKIFRSGASLGGHYAKVHPKK